MPSPRALRNSTAPKPARRVRGSIASAFAAQVRWRLAPTAGSHESVGSRRSNFDDPTASAAAAPGLLRLHHHHHLLLSLLLLLLQELSVELLLQPSPTPRFQ